MFILLHTSDVHGYFTSKSFVEKDAMESHGLSRAKTYIDKLREEKNCDVIIIAYHGGFEKDLETEAELEKQTGENEGYALLNSGLDFDILLTGHQHLSLAKEFKEKAYVQPGFAASNISEIKFDVVERKVKNIRADLIKLREYLPDEEMEEFLSKDMKNVDIMLDRNAGKINPSAKIQSIIKAQVEGHPFINLINQIQMETLGVDISATSIF